MANRRFGVGEPSTFIICNRDFQAEGKLIARKGQIVTQVVFEDLQKHFLMEQIMAGVTVENTTTLRKVRA